MGYSQTRRQQGDLINLLTKLRGVQRQTDSEVISQVLKIRGHTQTEGQTV
jgi:hypothetical protein